MKYATTIEEQIQKLKDRGLGIEDEEKAKEVLLDIGYYRFGSYLFPYEITYPSKEERTHKLKASTHFEDALDLYYFDSDLRMLLLPICSGTRVVNCFQISIFAVHEQRIII